MSDIPKYCPPSNLQQFHGGEADRLSAMSGDFDSGVSRLLGFYKNKDNSTNWFTFVVSGAGMFLEL